MTPPRTPLGEADGAGTAPAPPAHPMLRWIQPRALRAEYELRAGEERIATLRFRNLFGSRATGESAEGCWTFQRGGFFRTRVAVRRCDDATDLATFRSDRWRGGGTLTLPDGRRLRATTNFWYSRLQFQDEAGQTLLVFDTKGALRLRATVTIGPAAATLHDLPWLLMLGCYLVVIMHRDLATASAG